MKSIKIIFKYILGLLLTISIFFVFILLLAKLTVLNENYIYKTMDKIDYYNKVNETIKTKLIQNNMSSGFDDEILDDIYTINNIKKDVKSTINSLYTNKELKIDTNEIKNKLTINVDNYIKENKIKISDKKALDEHINILVKVYIDEITYYSYLNGYVDKIVKINKYANISLIIMVCLTILLLVLLLFIIKQNILPACLMAVGLFMIFMYYHTLINIDYQTITIISTNFSILIRNIGKNLMNIYTISSYIFIGLGLFLGIIKKIKE
jgi:hypothetical protein